MRTKAIIPILMILAMSVLAAGQSKEEVALESLVRQQVDAQTAFDRAKLDSLITADYIEISPVGEFDPRAKMLDFYKPELKPSGMEVKHQLNEFSTRSYGQFGIVIVRIDYSMSRGGTPLPPRSIRATFVCCREKGIWKIASAQYTGITPTAPPA